MRFLHGLRQAVEAGDVVIGAGEVEGTIGEEAFDHIESFFELVDADPSGLLGDTRLLVVGVHPSRAEPELESTARQHIERGRFLGQHDRMLVVVVVHQRADAQLRGRVGCGHQGGYGRQLIAEVIGHEQRREAEVFRLLGLLGPSGRGGGGGELKSEPECPRVSHLRTVAPVSSASRAQVLGPGRSHLSHGGRPFGDRHCSRARGPPARHGRIRGARTDRRGRPRQLRGALTGVLPRRQAPRHPARPREPRTGPAHERAPTGDRRDPGGRGCRLLSTQRSELSRHHAGVLRERERRRRRAGWFDHHPAARQERVVELGTRLRPQAQGDPARHPARGAALEGPDPREVPQHRLLRLGCLWRSGRGRDVLGRRRRLARLRRGGHARRAHREPGLLRSPLASRGGLRTAPAGPRAHGVARQAES